MFRAKCVKAAAYAMLFVAILVPTALFAQTAERRVAVTFDDLPSTHGDVATFEYVTKNLLEKLRNARVPAIGFVTEFRLFVPGEIDRRTATLQQWLDAGHDLGNHSFSHVSIDRATVDEYAADVIRGETVTRMLLEAKGKKLRYYRHTQLRTGPTDEYRRKLSDFLVSRGYTVAPVTIDNNDYIYANAYAHAKRRGDTVVMNRLAASYIEYMDSVFAHFEGVSRELLGREVSQTLLLHANEINADHFDKLAAMMKQRGYEFITLDEALKDEAYKLPEVTSRRGLSWLHRWTLAKGKPMNEEPLEPEWVREMAARR